MSLAGVRPNDEYSRSIKEYYDHASRDYSWIWKSYRHNSMHYGYHEPGCMDLNEAVLNRIRVLAEQADIDRDTRVLDAGCGLGGSSLWLAENTGAEILGVDINDEHVDHARNRASERGVSDRTEFHQLNFQGLDRLNESFDVIWFLESLIYAEDKAEVVEKAYELLAPGGRLIVSDGFQLRDNLSDQEREWLEDWSRGWAIPDVALVEDFENSIEDAGFRELTTQDLTEEILPSARHLYRWSLVGIPVSRFLELLGIRTGWQTQNTLSAYLQMRLIEHDVCTQVTFLAKK